MFEVFQQLPTIVGTGFQYQGRRYLEQQINRQLDQAMSYYRGNYFPVRSDHPLIRILHAFLDIDLDIDDEEYLHVVVAQYQGFTTMLGLNTPDMRAKANHRGQFFGKDIVDIYTGSDDISWYSAEWDWMEASPVTVLYHPRSDMLPVRPGLDFVSTERGVAVLEINVPMLLLQYKKWYESVVGKIEGGNVMRYVCTYPLVNMLPRVMDIAMFNIAYNMLRELPTPVVATSVPFMVLNNDRILRRMLQVAWGKLRTTVMGPDGILINTPTVSVGSAYDLQIFPDKITTQNMWAYMAMKLPYLHYVLLFLDKVPYGDARGVKLRVKLRRDVNRVLGQRVLVNGIDRKVSEYLVDWYLYKNISPLL